MGSQLSSSAGGVEFVIGESLSNDGETKQVVVEMIAQNLGTKGITELNRRVRELEQSGADLFFFFPDADEMLAFRRDGRRLVMIGDDGQRTEILNRLLKAYREEVEFRVRAEFHVERLAAQLRAASIEPDE